MRRRAGTEATITWKIRVPASVGAQVELLVMDPLTRKPSYGKRSALVTKLLRAHLKSIQFDVKDQVQKLYPDEVKQA